jgi:hypothetical protein
MAISHDIKRWFSFTQEAHQLCSVTLRFFKANSIELRLIYGLVCRCNGC